MAFKYAVGWVQKDRCGDSYKYVQYYLTNEVDVDILTSFDWDPNIKSLFDGKSTKTCDVDEFIKNKFGTTRDFLLEHENGRRDRVFLTIFEKGEYVAQVDPKPYQFEGEDEDPTRKIVVYKKNILNKMFS